MPAGLQVEMCGKKYTPFQKNHVKLVFKNANIPGIQNFKIILCEMINCLSPEGDVMNCAGECAWLPVYN
jgi:hypothetical protein